MSQQNKANTYIFSAKILPGFSYVPSLMLGVQIHDVVQFFTGCAPSYLQLDSLLIQQSVLLMDLAFPGHPPVT